MHVVTTPLLDNIISLLEIRTWLIVIFVLLIDFCVKFCCNKFPQTSSQLEIVSNIIILLQRKRLTNGTSQSRATQIHVWRKKKNWINWMHCTSVNLNKFFYPWPIHIFAFAWEAKRFASACFLYLLLHDFSVISGNLEKNNILQTKQQLIPFSYLFL